MSALHRSDLSSIPDPNDPDPCPIPGGGQPLNTTGYPTKPPVGIDSASKLKAILEPTLLSGFKPFQLFPSDGLLEFSIGDLQHLGKFENIRRLVFEIFFTKPADAELRTFSVVIASPEREVLAAIHIKPRDIKDRSNCQSFQATPAYPKPNYQFSLTEDEVLEVNGHFTRGNRLIIVAQANEEVTEGRIQLAVKKHQ